MYAGHWRGRPATTREATVHAHEDANHNLRFVLPDMFQIQGIHHVSLIVTDTDKALAFYRDLLGLEQDLLRPQLGFPGAWLKIAGQQIHLLELPNPDPVRDRPEHGGRDRHVALLVNNLAGLQAKLSEAAISYTMSRSGRNALFCRDPDGTALEFIETEKTDG